MYNVKEKRSAWWQCPKCGGNVTFASMDESFDEELGENQFYTVYSRECEECEAHGIVRRIDDLGRTVIPKETSLILCVREGELTWNLLLHLI